MGGMIAAVADDPNERGGGRRAGGALSFARRFLVSIGCAMAVIAIGTRVNRPSRAMLLNAMPRAADFDLPEVDWDPSTLKSAIESIKRAAPAGAIVVDVASLPEYESPPVPPYGFSKAHFRNVRLGTLVQMTLDLYRYDGRTTIRQESGRIVIGGPDIADERVTRRLYDVRDVLGPIEEDPPPSTGGGLFGGSGVFGVSPSAAPSWEGPYEAFARLVVEAGSSDGVVNYHDVESGWLAHAWSGWMVVDASDDGHREVEAILLLLRSGDPAAVRTVGGSR